MTRLAASRGLIRDLPSTLYSYDTPTTRKVNRHSETSRVINAYFTQRAACGDAYLRKTLELVGPLYKRTVLKIPVDINTVVQLGQVVDKR